MDARDIYIFFPSAVSSSSILGRGPFLFLCCLRHFIQEGLRAVAAESTDMLSGTGEVKTSSVEEYLSGIF